MLYPAKDTICLTCHSSCKSCSGGSGITNCDSCDTTGVTSYFYSVLRTCSASCPSGSYESDGFRKLCSQCNEECLTCTGALRTNCLTCDISNINTKCFWSETKTCTASCPEGSFLQNPGDTICKNCHSSCKSCSLGSAETNCNSCDTSGSLSYYFADTLTCTASCPKGSYISNAVSKLCSRCNSECLTCSGGARDNCLSCDTSNKNYKYYWSGSNTCTSICPEGSFLQKESDTICFTCDSSCKSCSGGSLSTYCESCNIAGATPFFFARSCHPACPSGSYESDSEKKLCSRCNPECLTCSAGTRTDCLTCDTYNTDYKFYWSVTKTCTSSCPEGSFLAKVGDTDCSNCHKSCKTCSGG